MLFGVLVQTCLLKCWTNSYLFTLCTASALAFFVECLLDNFIYFQERLQAKETSGKISPEENVGLRLVTFLLVKIFSGLYVLCLVHVLPKY